MNYIFITLAVLKNGSVWEFITSLFEINPSSFPWMVTKFVDVLSSIAFEQMVIASEKIPPQRN